MILSDVEIKRELAAGNLVITPAPGPEAISTSSIDIHLSDTLFVPKTDMSVAVQLDSPDVHLLQDQLYERVKIPAGGYNVEPRSFVLSYTAERVELPPDLAAWLEGRSTLARFGLAIHMTAPIVHPTFGGHLMLEISVFGNWPCTLKPGLSIAQLVLARVGEPTSETLRSRWQGQGS